MQDIKECFVICPIGESNSEIRKRSDQLLRFVLEPVLSECGYKAVRSDSMPKSGMITKQIINMIMHSPLVIADLTGGNPNVFYELALRHVSFKPYIQMINEGENIPFDIQGVRTINVNLTDLDSVENAKKELSNQIDEILSGHKVDSPVSLAMAENLLSNNDNALSLFLEKFWGIEERLEEISSVIERDTVSIMEDVLDYRLDSLADDIIDRISTKIDQKV